MDPMTNMHMGMKTVTPQAIMKINYCHFFKKNSSNQSAISAVNKIAVEKDEIIESKITSNS